MTMTHQRADTTLNATLRGGATPHLWLHTADPGAAGTNAVAQIPSTGNIVRKAISFNAPANHPTNIERRCLSSALVSWTGAEIAAGQTITHFSIWSAAAAGTPEHIATVAVAKMTGSDGVNIEANAIECAISVHVRP